MGGSGLLSGPRSPSTGGWRSFLQLVFGPGGLTGSGPANVQTAWKTISVSGRPTDGQAIYGRPPNR